MPFWRILAGLTSLLVGVAIPVAMSARCDPPNLRAPIRAFDARHVSRVEALLKLGQEYNVCFGIEYVDNAN
jgi:hypothetical protein